MSSYEVEIAMPNKYTLNGAGTSNGGRCRNFTEKEKSMLVDLVGQHVSVIECKRIDAKSVLEKNWKWQKIQEEFNALSDTYRTTAQLRTMWKNAKARSKKLSALNACSLICSDACLHLNFSCG